MVLKSKYSTHTLAGLLGLCVLLTSVAAVAQVSGEALWRVDNELAAEPAPLYEGQASPFPIEEAPVVVRNVPVVDESPVLSKQEVAAQQQAREAASRMSRIRDLLKDEEAFIPDTSGVKISAIAKGQAGPMVLMKGNWFFEGDTIEAPVTTANELMELMGGLEQIDKNLANIVSQEVEARLNSIGPRKVLIKKINDQSVVLRRPDGKTVVISFVSQGW